MAGSQLHTHPTDHHAPPASGRVHFSIEKSAHALRERKQDSGRCESSRTAVGGGPQQAQATPHLEGLHEGPEQDADGVALAQQLDEPGSAEETQKAEVDEVVLGGQGCPLTFRDRPPAWQARRSPATAPRLPGVPKKGGSKGRVNKVSTPWSKQSSAARNLRKVKPVIPNQSPRSTTTHCAPAGPAAGTEARSPKQLPAARQGRQHLRDSPTAGAGQGCFSRAPLKGQALLVASPFPCPHSQQSPARGPCRGQPTLWGHSSPLQTGHPGGVSVGAPGADAMEATSPPTEVSAPEGLGHRALSLAQGLKIKQENKPSGGRR